MRIKKKTASLGPNFTGSYIKKGVKYFQRIHHLIKIKLLIRDFALIWNGGIFLNKCCYAPICNNCPNL